MKSNTSGSGRKKEVVPVPNRKELTDASKELRKGHSSGGRVMSQGAAAKGAGSKTSKRR